MDWMLIKIGEWRAFAGLWRGIECEEGSPPSIDRAGEDRWRKAARYAHSGGHYPASCGELELSTSVEFASAAAGRWISHSSPSRP
jgi:hypothetical protein